jgi:hypothetical protein
LTRHRLQLLAAWALIWLAAVAVGAAIGWALYTLIT